MLPATAAAAATGWLAEVVVQDIRQRSEIKWKNFLAYLVDWFIFAFDSTQPPIRYFSEEQGFIRAQALHLHGRYSSDGRVKV